MSHNVLSLSGVIPSIEAVAETIEAAKIPGDVRVIRVPVYREFIADLETPVSTYLKLRDQATCSFLLESVEGGERLGRYSFVGSHPSEVIKVGDGCPQEGDPLKVLEEHLKQSRLVVPVGVKLPEFTGGAVGYVGYDCVRFFEPRTADNLASQANVLQIPDAVFIIANTVVVFDHVRHTIKIVAHCSVHPSGDAADVRASYDAACVDIEGVLERLAHPLASRLRSPPMSPPGKSTLPSASASTVAAYEWDTASNMGREGYESAVRSLQEHIVNGNIIQAVPSHRVSRVLPEGVNAFDVYRQLRVVNPSPYMFFLSLSDDFQVTHALIMCAIDAPSYRYAVFLLLSIARSSALPPKCS